MKENESRVPIWHLRTGMDRRFRSGHPWVYSNEIRESPKGITPGDIVELRDPAGGFLARGFGNPNSLIAFRCLTRNPEEKQPLSSESVVQALEKAQSLRERVGFGNLSYRLCFGEGDSLPGLVIDRYVIPGGQVFVVQAHSAGMDRIIPRIEDILQRYNSRSGLDWERTAIVLRNDLSVRKLEGVVEEDPKILKGIPGVDLTQVAISVMSVLDEKSISFEVDLVQGQKTGFFLDQYANIQLAALRFRNLNKKSVRILDLCSYVGQWSAHLSQVFTSRGIKVEVLAVDSSAKALEFAKKNIEAQGANCETLKADVLKDLQELPEKTFDIVISDPPALIKTRKDVPTGKHAYLQLATQAFRLVKAGGGVVCCSCSALLDEETFGQGLVKASQRNQRPIQWVGRGAQSPDHPMLLEFPEGKYLKCWIGLAKKEK